jgi:hypothetical protein
MGPSGAGLSAPGTQKLSRNTAKNVMGERTRRATRQTNLWQHHASRTCARRWDGRRDPHAVTNEQQQRSVRGRRLSRTQFGAADEPVKELRQTPAGPTVAAWRTCIPFVRRVGAGLGGRFYIAADRHARHRSLSGSTGMELLAKKKTSCNKSKFCLCPTE